MAKTQHPWQIGPTELIEFALEHKSKGSDVDRRLAYLILDVGVETLFKTFLTLPDGAMQFHIKRAERMEASQANFHDLTNAVQRANPGLATNINFTHIEHYHNLRNTLYHQGNQVMTVPMEQLEGYSRLAVELLHKYLDVDLSEQLVSTIPGSSGTTDSVVDSVETEISSGRYRIERLISQTIRVIALDKHQPVDPVKPFLRSIIGELSLPIGLTNKSGMEKNTRALGREVIDELKPSAWHHLSPGQRVNRDSPSASPSRPTQNKRESSPSQRSSFGMRSNISQKFRITMDKLHTFFPAGQEFLSHVSNPSSGGFWISSSTNAHLYYNDSFLAFMKVSRDSILFSPSFNGKIDGSTIDRHKLVFPDVFRRLSKDINGQQVAWIQFSGDDSVTLTNQAPREFFTKLLDEIVIVLNNANAA